MLPIVLSIDLCVWCTLPSVKPENFKLIVNDSTICQGDVTSITCSAEGKPTVHYYQLFENKIPVTDGNSSAVVWTRMMLTGGEFTYTCVAKNTVGTSQKNVTVTVKGTISQLNLRHKQNTIRVWHRENFINNTNFK